MVFGLLGEGDWRLVLDRIAFIFRLAVVGSDIRETSPVFRQGDSRCNPSGGVARADLALERHALRGGRLEAGNAGEAAPPACSRSGYFKTPSGNMRLLHHSPGPRTCRGRFWLWDQERAQACAPRRPCAEGGYAGDRVSMNATGHVSVPPCAGDPGALVGEREATVLAYGKTWSGGGLRRTSAVAGLTCRNKSGHGFFLSRAAWRTF